MTKNKKLMTTHYVADRALSCVETSYNGIKTYIILNIPDIFHVSVLIGKLRIINTQNVHAKLNIFNR